MTPLELARLVEFGEAAAYAEMFRAAPASFGFVVEETGLGTLLMAPKFDVAIFNRVIGLGLGEVPTSATTSALVRRFREQRVRNFAVQVSPVVDVGSIADWLGAAGLALRDRWTKVYRSNAPVQSVPTDFRVEQIGRDLAELFGRTACTGFGMPPVLAPVIGASVGRPGWSHYIAFDADTAAAVGALFADHGVGRLCVAATLPAFRRRGAQGALMSRRLEDGIRLGCRWFVTETGEDRPDKPNPSFHNMVRNGFTVAYHRPNFMES